MVALRFPQERGQPLTTPQDEEKLLPQNCDAEMALLGSVLIGAAISPACLIYRTMVDIIGHLG
jgi:hypothetical protein